MPAPASLDRDSWPFGPEADGPGLRAVLDQAPNAIVVVSADGLIRYANPTAELGFGYEPGELVGQEVEVLIPDALRTAHVQHRMERDGHLATRPMGSGMELAARRRDGTAFPAEVSLSPIEVAGGLVYLATVIDISERKRLELELIQSHKIESVGRLAGGIAHDFNNLLTAILGYGNLALDALPPDSPARPDVEEIRRAAERAAGLTGQLLAFSRRQVLTPRVIEVNEVVAAIAPLIQRLIGERVLFRTILADHDARVRVDVTQIEQVIVNLALNARDAMPAGGTLTIETSTVHDHGLRVGEPRLPSPMAVIAVTDTGTGIAPEVRDHLFEPFFTTKPEAGGTGLGLATSHGVVRQSGGDIAVYSEWGFGSTFRIYLPLVVDAADSAGETVLADGGPYGHETILLVEDDEAVRRLAQKILESRGYRVIVAADATEALALMRGATDENPQSFDLLLTDVIMPGLTGPELHEQLKAERPGLPAVFVSGYTQAFVSEREFVGANAAFLAKPFTPEALARRVREVLDGRERPET